MEVIENDNKESRGGEILTEIEIDLENINQQELLLKMLLSHKKEYVQNFLKERELPYSYTKRELLEKLKDGLEDESFYFDDLIRLLDNIEEFGNQHIYLYSCTPEYLHRLKEEAYVRSKLEENGIEDKYNSSDALLIPSEPTISSIIHTDRLLKFKWVEKRIWKQLISEEIQGDKFIKTYQIHITRGVTTFRVDLITGNAELMIQRLPSGTRYGEIKENYLSKLASLIEINALSQINLRRAIKRIEESDEVEKRGTNLQTISGGKIAFQSRSRGVDYTSDPELHRARNALGQNVSGHLGNFYWLPNDILTRKVHTKIYGNDDRVGIFGECTEMEVNYVLSRIRYFASQ